ncbi:hypothetical protein BHM03_00050462 [Ensete ventricosum]|nr:hypothetical protein BHM03_00050462 [Ensete ventricosum]
MSELFCYANTGCCSRSPVDVPVVELYAVIEESSSFGFVFVRKLIKVGREEALEQYCTPPDPRVRSEPTICLLMSTAAPITSSCFLSDGPKQCPFSRQWSELSRMCPLGIMEVT